MIFNLSEIVSALLALGTTSGFFYILYTLIHSSEIQSSSRELLNILLGSLGTVWVQVMSYYFGASKRGNQSNNARNSSPPGITDMTVDTHLSASTPLVKEN